MSCHAVCSAAGPLGHVLEGEGKLDKMARRFSPAVQRSLGRKTARRGDDANLGAWTATISGFSVNRPPKGLSLWVLHTRPLPLSNLCLSQYFEPRPP